jgi:hypothetical protein
MMLREFIRRTDRAFVLLCCLFLAGPAMALQPSPEDVVRQLYPQVHGEGNALIDLKSEVSPCLVCFATEVIERDERGLHAVFTDPLASFLTRWALEEGIWVLECVDFEPLVDGQDYIITGFVMMTESMDDDEARVIVRFNNFETPVRLRFDLVRRGGSWLIDDIESPEYSLRELVRPCLD